MNKTERCVGYYLDEKDANPAFRPDSASLEDGSVLKALLDKFDGRRDDKALYAVMRCLRDSFLYVKSDMSDFLTDRGRRYLKAFAGFKEGKAEKRRALVSELIKAVEANKELYGVAIEPDTHRFLLGADFMEILKFMQCNSMTSNIKLIGGAENAGKNRISKLIQDSDVKMISCSPTGYFCKVVDFKRFL